MKSDVEIARTIKPRPIADLVRTLGLDEADLHPYGHSIGKIDLAALNRPRVRPGESNLILVSAITPTPAGEGKTTTSIGLADGLSKIGESACLALREPSLGPCMGIKGGATGGGYSQVIPMERINLHFTGDFHAITSANNALAAMLDNHLHQGNALDIDPRRVTWRRVLDLNDRALRNTVIGLGGTADGVARETGFDITAASEIMAILCLARDLEDLRARIARTLVAYSHSGERITASDLGATGMLVTLLLDALQPNLVQTLEGTPALLHGGPFANIAHGCNSVLATRMAMHLADWTITEAGFGFDLGAEKFLDIKCVSAGLRPAAVVLVVTVRACKMHGGVHRSELATPNAEAVGRGLENLEKHLESVAAFGLTPVVALNQFAADTEAEIDEIRRRCSDLGVDFAVSDHHARGGDGAIELAHAVVSAAAVQQAPYTPLYDWSDPVEEKIEAVAKTVYGAREVIFTKTARRDLRIVERMEYADLPICIAKIPGSLSDNPTLLGRPKDFDITVREIQVNAGAGFLVVLTGTIMRMPGLPKKPLAESIDVVDGVIVGLE